MAGIGSGPPEKAGLREAYEAGRKMADLAQEFRLHPSTIRRRAVAGDWVRRGQIKASAERPQGAEGQERVCTGFAACVHRNALHARLYAGLERRIAAFAAAKPGEVERDVKVLTALVQALQRLADMDKALAMSSEGEITIDAARIHQELARRLSLLADAPEEGPLSQGAE